MQALAPTLKDAGQAAKAFADAGAPIQ
jgi:hypothetical protein